MAVHFLRATAGGRVQRLGHSFIRTALTVDADVRGLIAVAALSLFHPRSVMSKVALNHDTFSATPSQGWAVRISASGRKGAFPASDRCGQSGKEHRPGVYVRQSERAFCEDEPLIPVTYVHVWVSEAGRDDRYM